MDKLRLFPFSEMLTSLLKNRINGLFSFIHLLLLLLLLLLSLLSLLFYFWLPNSFVMLRTVFNLFYLLSYL